MDIADISTVVEVAQPKWAEWRQHKADHARRLFHGRGHCYPGLEHVVVNWYPPYLHIGLYESVDQRVQDALVEGLSDALGGVVEGIVVQERAGRATRTSIVRGRVPEEHLVKEHGLNYWINPTRNQNAGLFMDMSHVRSWLATQMQGKRVLNLFAYTCAFSVSAIANGAVSVVNNDMSKNVLALGRRNHAANHHDPRMVSMVPHNLFKSWWKLRQLAPYDIVIVDPPTNQRGSFVAEKSYGQVLKRLPEMSSSGALLVACLNSPFLGAEFISQQVARWCPRARFLHQFPLHEDYPDAFPERALKVQAYRLN